ncbi:MAG: hypothetical protein AVDCRST_MAG64-3360, partial [uncultured Phycisphaerae bacterium]
ARVRHRPPAQRGVGAHRHPQPPPARALRLGRGLLDRQRRAPGPPGDRGARPAAQGTQAQGRRVAGGPPEVPAVEPRPARHRRLRGDGAGRRLGLRGRLAVRQQGRAARPAAALRRAVQRVARRGAAARRAAHRDDGRRPPAVPDPPPRQPRAPRERARRHRGAQARAQGVHHGDAARRRCSRTEAGGQARPRGQRRGRHVPAQRASAPRAAVPGHRGGEPDPRRDRRHRPRLRARPREGGLRHAGVDAPQRRHRPPAEGHPGTRPARPHDPRDHRQPREQPGREPDRQGPSRGDPRALRALDVRGAGRRRRRRAAQGQPGAAVRPRRERRRVRALRGRLRVVRARRRAHPPAGGQRAAV